MSGVNLLKCCCGEGEPGEWESGATFSGGSCASCYTYYYAGQCYSVDSLKWYSIVPPINEQPTPNISRAFTMGLSQAGQGCNDAYVSSQCGPHPVLAEGCSVGGAIPWASVGHTPDQSLTIEFDVDATVDKYGIIPYSAGGYSYYSRDDLTDDIDTLRVRLNGVNHWLLHEQIADRKARNDPALSETRNFVRSFSQTIYPGNSYDVRFGLYWRRCGEAVIVRRNDINFEYSYSEKPHGEIIISGEVRMAIG